jgi:hypothetical protein
VGTCSGFVAIVNEKFAATFWKGETQSAVQRARPRDDGGRLLAGVGVVIGLAGAFGLHLLIASLLFGVGPTDVSTVAVVTATMIFVAAVACLLPAWRASRLDPNAMLRG